MRLDLRAILAAMSGLYPKPPRPQDQRRDGEETVAPASQDEQSENDIPPAEWTAFQTLIREIHRSERDQQAAERELAAAQLQTAKSLNRITAVGAIVGAISSLGVIGFPGYS
jgi:hypothetical protein